jgi:hypothetical protein
MKNSLAVEDTEMSASMPVSRHVQCVNVQPVVGGTFQFAVFRTVAESSFGCNFCQGRVHLEMIDTVPTTLDGMDQ